MTKEQQVVSKPCVIVISGYVGSGKSTVVAKLSEQLGNVPTLIFDHYEKHIEWPQDMRQWIQDGADPSGIRVPKLKEDLLSLLNGRSIKYPLGDKIVSSADYIILEEPSGRERQEIREYIDLVLYVDVPQDVCVTRLVQRVLDMEVWEEKGTFADESKEDLVRQLDAVAMWITHYQKIRAMYLSGSSAVRQNADVLIDGMKSVNEITSEILNTIHEKFGNPI
ncbi:MAG: hypothetical protein A2Z49_12625 [Chloroflexi bacterium RBG_19FT_COMBO_56_12]|nr:MAG: hypothetical protein A2Z49_12625 [Chloroflexi bacterium RBG_19FT_COMBO_56_12]